MGLCACDTFYDIILCCLQYLYSFSFSKKYAVAVLDSDWGSGSSSSFSLFPSSIDAAEPCAASSTPSFPISTPSGWRSLPSKNAVRPQFIFSRYVRRCVLESFTFGVYWDSWANSSERPKIKGRPAAQRSLPALIAATP